MRTITSKPEKPLKLWNGRLIHRGKEIQFYAAAHSLADLTRMFTEYFGFEDRGLPGQIKKYWNSGCWGVAMMGVTPTRGIWATSSYEDATPVQVFPLSRQ